MKKIVLMCLFLLMSLDAREIIDMGGKKVEIPEKITKVFGSSPPSTYMIYTIDASLIVGLNFNHARGNNESSNMLDPRFMALPIVGGLQGGGNSMNRETLLSLHPDVVFLWNNDASSQLAQYLFESSKIPSINVELESVESLPKAYLFFGEVLERMPRARVLSKYAKEALEKTKNVVQINALKRPVVYYAEGADGLATECAESFHFSPIKFVGIRSAFDCIQKTMVGMEKVSMEALLAKNPDVIIASDEKFFKSVYADSRWSAIKAVKNKRVYLVPKDPVNFLDRPPSFMKILGVEWLASVIYPKEYKKDILSETASFYKLYLRKDISKAEAAKILGK